MNDYISASPAFRRSILALLLFTDWMQRYGTILQPIYFPSKDEQKLVEWINWYFDAYNVVPSDADIDNEFGDSQLVGTVYDVDDSSLDYAADTAMEFARLQAMKIAVLESVDDIGQGKLDRIMDRVETALNIGTDITSLGYDFEQEADSWMYDEIHGRRYPTGWTEVDKILGGGLVGGEYGLMMAPTGRGKSMALVNIGFAMAGIMSAANVLHLTYEMPESKVLKRYATRTTGVVVPRGSGQRQYIDQLRKDIKTKLRANLRVVKPQNRTVAGIRMIISGLAYKGFDVGALIVDYPDLMIPTRKRSEVRFELADLTREIRTIGEDYDMPIWGATQAGRQSLYKDVITVADIAEAIEKANVADVIMAICQTRDEEKLRQGRLFLAKIRDSEAGASVPVNLDFARCFIQQRGRMVV